MTQRQIVTTHDLSQEDYFLRNLGAKSVHFEWLSGTQYSATSDCRGHLHPRHCPRQWWILQWTEAWSLPSRNSHSSGNHRIQMWDQEGSQRRKTRPAHRGQDTRSQWEVEPTACSGCSWSPYYCPTFQAREPKLLLMALALSWVFHYLYSKMCCVWISQA